MADLQILDAPSETSDEASDEQIVKLNALGLSLAKSRSEAIEYRSSTGIENEWAEDREHYEGIDDANRGELGSWESKPPGQSVLGGDDVTSSTVFFNITRPYCDTASARVGDMLLPTDDKGWALNATPIPDMVAIAGGDIPYRIEQQIRSQTSSEEEAEGIMNEVIANEKMIVEDAKAAAKRAEKRIDDWHKQCQYNAEMRMVIDESAQMGTGVMKGPIPENKRHIAFLKGQLIERDELQPVSRRVPIFNCFPNKACGQNIQNGADHWEKDDISEKSLQDLKDQDGYLKSQIDMILTEGPFAATKAQDALKDNEQFGIVKRDKTKLFEIWYYYGRLNKDDLTSAGLDIDDGEDLPKMDVHMVIVNNRVIRAAPNHLDGGEFPYDYMVWQPRNGIPFGIGIARQIRVPQRIINGAGRNLMDNAGMAGGPMWAFNQGILEPLDGIYEIAPRKGWIVSEDAEDSYDVKNAFSFIDMPMLQNDLQSIIQLGMSFAEYISGLPSLLQGQEQKVDETLGGQRMRRNDGSTVLRRVARQYDDKITTPHIRRYYTWILLYGEDNEKGDFSIEARGSSALVERDLMNESIQSMGSFVLEPRFGVDPKKWFEQWLMSQKLDPKNFAYSDDEWKQVVENMSAPPPDSSLQIAEMRVQFEQFKLQAGQQFETGKIMNDNEQKAMDRELDMVMEGMHKEFESMLKDADYLGKKDINMDNVKQRMADTMITLKAQIEMNDRELATPKVEPAGRAEDGKSFEQ